MFNTGLFNTTPFNAEPNLGDIGQVELWLEQVSEAGTGQAAIRIRQASADYGQGTLLLTQESEPANHTVSLLFIQESSLARAAEVYLHQASEPLSAGYNARRSWEIKVYIDGVDYSSYLTGQWSIDAEEGMSRIATIKLMPWASGIDVLEFVRKPITITGGYFYSATASTRYPLFSGRILEPIYSLTDRLITFKCSDLLQERLGSMTFAGIQTEVGGLFSANVYGEELTGIELAELLSLSQHGSYDIDVDGAGHFADWIASSAPDHRFGNADVIEDSTSLELANARGMHTVTEIAFDYRFTRKRYRSYTYAWEMEPKVGCEFLHNPFQLPQRGMIESACNNTAWRLEALSFEPLPEPQVFHCMQNGKLYPMPWGYEIRNASLVPDPDIELLCQGFSARFSKRWAQTVTEQYRITINASNAGALGRIVRNLETGMETEFDYEAWEAELEQEDRHYQSAGASITGDRIRDVDDETQIDRAAANGAMEAIKAIETGRMLQVFRKNYVTFRTLLYPAIERHHRGEVTLDNLEAAGKVYQVLHAGDIETGDATTSITLALFRPGAAAIERAGEVINVGSLNKPDSDVGTPDEGRNMRFSAGATHTHIGGSIASPTLDEEWTGFFTNYGYDNYNTQPFNVYAPTAEMYPVQFILPTPAIESELRQAVEVEADPVSVEVTLPVDKLIYS